MRLRAPGAAVRFSGGCLRNRAARGGRPGDRREQDGNGPSIPRGVVAAADLDPVIAVPGLHFNAAEAAVARLV